MTAITVCPTKGSVLSCYRKQVHIYGMASKLSTDEIWPLNSPPWGRTGESGPILDLELMRKFIVVVDTTQNSENIKPGASEFES
jgi:hypothetical protein